MWSLLSIASAVLIQGTSGAYDLFQEHSQLGFHRQPDLSKCSLIESDPRYQAASPPERTDDEFLASLLRHESPDEAAASERMSVDFALRWYRAVADDKSSTENLIISPLSMQSLMNIAYQAIGDENATSEISEAVFGGLSQLEVARIFARGALAYNHRNSFDLYGNPIPTDEAVVKYTADVLAYKDKLNEPYKRDVLHCFKVMTLVTSNIRQAVTNSINAQLSKITRGMINRAVDPALLSPDTNLLMVNALFFNASWAHPFTKENGAETFESMFYVMKTADKLVLKEAQAVETTFMSMVGWFPFYEELVDICSRDKQKVLALNYTGDNHTMYFVMPKTDTSFDQFEREFFDYDNWSQILDKFTIRETIVTLPKFSMSLELSAMDSLRSLGLERLFQGVDMSRAFYEKTEQKIDMINHKVVLQVHERGTTGAAVSSMSGISTSAKATFQANRAFAFVVYDHSQRTVLFVGRYVNPDKTHAANFV